VVDLPLWKIWKPVGMIIPNIWKNKTCSKLPNHQPGRVSELTSLRKAGASNKTLVVASQWAVPTGPIEWQNHNFAARVIAFSLQKHYHESSQHDQQYPSSNLLRWSCLCNQSWAHLWFTNSTGLKFVEWFCIWPCEISGWQDWLSTRLTPPAIYP